MSRFLMVHCVYHLISVLSVWR